jgi:hypothetical protein
MEFIIWHAIAGRQIIFRFISTAPNLFCHYNSDLMIGGSLGQEILRSPGVKPTFTFSENQETEPVLFPPRH